MHAEATGKHEDNDQSRKEESCFMLGIKVNKWKQKQTRQINRKTHAPKVVRESGPGKGIKGLRESIFTTTKLNLKYPTFPFNKVDVYRQL